MVNAMDRYHYQFGNFSDLNEIQVFSSSIKIIIWSLRTIKNKSKERLTI